MTTKQWPQPAVYLMLSGTWFPQYPRRSLFDLMAFFCSPNVWGLNSYVAHTWRYGRELLPQKGGDCVVWMFSCRGWGRGGEGGWGETGYWKLHQVTLRKVGPRLPLPRILCAPGGARGLLGWRHCCFGSAPTTQCHSASLSRLDGIARIPQHNRAKCWSKEVVREQTSVSLFR